MADKTGYIGRNPNDSAVTVARQFFTASGVTTAFTFASGYLTGYLDVYVDGVKKRVADEFTATDGSTFDVLQGGVGAGSTVEAVAYKAFNAAAVSGDITGNFDVSGNTTLGGSLDVTGGTTITNLVVTGISTLGTGTTVGFANTAFNLGGTPNISVDLLSAVDINVSGAATIGGVLTYEDVTNIDSIGIVTARTGIEVTANGLVVNAGVSTLAADLSIADKIVHTGDTNTAIRFPSADTITAETAGVERLRIDSTGDVGLVGIATATGLVVVAGSGIYAGHTGVVTAVSFDGSFTGNVTGAASQVTVADESSDTTCFPLFATAATGNLPPKSGSNLTFNSSSGALTATSFVGALTGNATGLTGTPNIDCGTGSFTGDVDIADKIIHTGDTNTAIRFPAADTFTVETAGSETARFTSSAITFKAPDGGSRYNFGELGNSSHAELSLYNSSDAQKVRIAANNDTYFNGGNVIVNGTTTGSSAKFEVKSTTGSINSATARINGEDTTTGAIDTGSSLLFAGHDGSNSRDFGSIFAGKENGTSSNYAAYLAFGTRANGSSLAEKLRITSAGNVRVPDSGRFTCGTDDDLALRHSGTTGVLENNTGHFFIDQNTNDSDIYLRSDDGSGGVTNYVQCDGSTTSTILSFGGNTRLETTADGADFSGTGSIKVPVGTTGQRNSSPTAGDFRYNSTDDKFEGYTTEWGEIGGGGGGMSTAAHVVSNDVVHIALSAAQDHKITATGICTIFPGGGTEGDSHTIRIINSGISTVGFSTQFLFPSGSVPSLPTASGAISIISFTVNKVGVVGIATELLSGASLNYS